MIKAIAHICIATKDLNKTERFYCDYLGLSKKFDFIQQGKRRGFYLQVNEHNFIEVFRTDAETSDEKEPRIWHFCLEVDNIDKAIEDIRKQGVSIPDKEMGADNAWQTWLTDPNGVKIELHQYTDKSCQITGTDCMLPEKWG